MSRSDEISQGLRDEGGRLIGGLNVLDYVCGFEDFDAGVSPPSFSTRDYDLGRWRAAERREVEVRVLGEIERRAMDSREAVRREILSSGRLDILAEYDARMAELGYGRVG